MPKVIHGVAEDIKFCPRCKEVAIDFKQIMDRFGRDRQRKDGLAVYCKECRNRTAKRRYHKQDLDPTLQECRTCRWATFIDKEEGRWRWSLPTSFSLARCLPNLIDLDRMEELRRPIKRGDMGCAVWEKA